MDWLTLAFPPPFEEDFRSGYVRASMFQVRLALVLGIFLYCFFGVLDAWIVPEAKLKLWFIRYLCALPYATFIFLCTYARFFERYMQPLMASLVAVAGIGIVAMTVIAPPGAGYSYYAGLILTLIYGYSFTRLRFIWASATGWIIVISYEIAAIGLTETPMVVLIGNNFFFLSSNILLMFASYSFEFNLRRDYLQTRMLEAETKKVLDGNTALELRTRELEIAKERAESASRAKSEFLANMSHEFRTPLNHIIGFTEMVTDKHFGELNPVQQEYLEDVLGSSRHLLFLINDILDISKVESGKMEFELAEVNIRTLLDSSLMIIKEKAMKHRISLGASYDFSMPNPLPETILADARKLKQVMYNLLSNAVKFTPDGGKVHLTARFSNGSEIIVDPAASIEDGIPSLNPAARWLCVSVTDTGIGVKREDQERIFAPFEQVDNSASRMYEGTGLGLSLTRSFVALHGGKIWVESEGEGKGSRFTFIIPY